MNSSIWTTLTRQDSCPEQNRSMISRTSLWIMTYMEMKFNNEIISHEQIIYQNVILILHTSNNPCSPCLVSSMSLVACGHTKPPPSLLHFQRDIPPWSSQASSNREALDDKCLWINSLSCFVTHSLRKLNALVIYYFNFFTITCVIYTSL